jgi:hypothetical protein
LQWCQHRPAGTLLIYKSLAQFHDSLDTIIRNPSSRRILFAGFSP